MDVHNFVAGLIIGFSIAAPVGPIGVLCIRRTLTSGRLSGLVSGLGAATADGLYGCVAAFGLTFISNILIHQQVWLRLLGGLFLCYLGLKAFISIPDDPAAQSSRPTLFSSYASTFFLTLTNPLTILSFAAIFAGLGVKLGQSDYAIATVTVLGVFLGSACWWVLLTSVVHLVRTRFQPSGLLWVNRISGMVILGFGIFALAGMVSLL
ncbi:MAG: LysE family translocator [Acidobacteriaceae bacterium]